MAVVKSPKNTKRKFLWISKNSKLIKYKKNRITLYKNINFSKKYVHYINMLKIDALKDMGIYSEEFDLNTINIYDLDINVKSTLNEASINPVYSKRSRWFNSQNKHLYKKNILSYLI